MIREAVRAMPAERDLQVRAALAHAIITDPARDSGGGAEAPGRHRRKISHS